MLKSVLTLVFLTAVSLSAKAVPPFDDALHLWNFADAKDAKGNLDLKINGDVKLGVDDGDEKVARFDGGYLSIGDHGVIPLTGQQWTILVRVRDPKGDWLGPIFGSYGSEKEVSFALRAVDGSTLPFEDRNNGGGINNTIESWIYGAPGGPREVRGSHAHLQFKWGAEKPSEEMYRKLMIGLKATGNGDVRGFPLEEDLKNGVMYLGFPLQVLGLTDWHTIVVRCTGANLQLYVDGVFVDEDYPIGTLRPSTVPCLFGARIADGKVEGGFKGEMDLVAVWNRALSPEEITQLSGGPDAVKQHATAYNGPVPTQFQYYRPPSYNQKAGDSFPLNYDGQFHLFYIKVRRNQHSKWYGGHGAASIYHASSKDMIHWEEHPDVIPVSEQWEGWNGTGQVVVKDGKWYIFYPCPSDSNKQPFAGIQLATSPDGEHWEKQTPHPWVKGGDCDVVTNTESGSYDLLRGGDDIPAALPKLADRTLVAWAEPADSKADGGAVVSLTADKGKVFEGIVRSKDSWSLKTSFKGKSQSMAAKPAQGLQQIAAVTQGNKTTLYCNGQIVEELTSEKETALPAGSELLLGLLNETNESSPEVYFTGAINDARLYDRALTPDELQSLKPATASDPKPLVWYDFESNEFKDKAGTIKAGEQVGNPVITKGQFTLDGYSYLVAGSAMKTIQRLTSKDLLKWEEQPGYFIAAEDNMGLTACPHTFQWKGWWYYFGGRGTWRSKERYGPWVRNVPDKLDPISVPKTGSIPGTDRRVMVGFLADGNWGGNEIFRELIQNPDGSLGTKWVPEMIPATGEPLPVKLSAASPGVTVDGNAVAIDSSRDRAFANLADVPTNCRLSFKITPKPGVKEYGLQLRTDSKGSESCNLEFSPADRTVRFDCVTDSRMTRRTGVAFTSKVTGLEKPITVDMIFYHDVIDVEVDGRRTLVNRFWNPGGTNLRFWTEGSGAAFSEITLRPLIKEPLTFPPGANQQITTKE